MQDREQEAEQGRKQEAEQAGSKKTEQQIGRGRSRQQIGQGAGSQIADQAQENDQRQLGRVRGELVARLSKRLVATALRSSCKWAKRYFPDCGQRS